MVLSQRLLLQLWASPWTSWAMAAVQLVLRKSLAHGDLARGLHEGTKVIEKHAAAQLCVVAEDSTQPDYVKLVKALCADQMSP